jgi:putative DNA primase/helicase
MSYMDTDDGSKCVTPIPANAPPLPRHGRFGMASKVWNYTDMIGDPLVHICRFDFHVDGSGKAEKIFLPLTLWQTPDGRLEWQWKSLDDPRPIYRLKDICASSPETLIVISEGEKAADAAARLFPEAVATTSMNGANAAGKSDWFALRGRHCIIAPDLDAAGERYAQAVIEELRRCGAGSIRILDMEKLAREIWRDDVVVTHEDVKSGFDLADAEAGGWTADRIAAALAETPGLLKPVELPDLPLGIVAACEPQVPEETPHVVNPVNPVSAGVPGWRFYCDEAGVWQITEVYDKRTRQTTERTDWVCSPLHVEGRARTAEGEDWGQLVRLTDPDGREKRIVLTSADFGTTGEVYRRLMSAGLSFLPTRSGRDLLLQYILGSTPSARIIHTKAPGWIGQTFALPGASFGPETVICDMGDADHRYRVSGSYETWKDMAALAVGNSRLAFALSLAFSGPLLVPLQHKPGGVHFFGDMGSGKTTLGEVAGSVFGGGGKTGYVRSWEGSTSAHESIGVMTNDCLLVLDEIGTADKNAVAPVCYIHGNGLGKNRADPLGRAKTAQMHGTTVLSSGEKSIAQAIADQGDRPMAGQLIRILDVPADAKSDLGIFDTLHGFVSDRALAMHLSSVALEHYGHASHDYLRRLTSDLPGAQALVRRFIDEFLAEECPAGTSRQVLRGASRFALIAAAGELAAAWAVVPWPQGEALCAAKQIFRDWLAGRKNPTHAAEYVDAIETVQRFISLHGASRFERIRSSSEREDLAFERPILNRAGYRRDLEGGSVYMILPQVWKGEVCGKLQADRVAEVLMHAELLEPGENGRIMKKVRLPGQNSRKRRLRPIDL